MQGDRASVGRRCCGPTGHLWETTRNTPQSRAARWARMGSHRYVHTVDVPDGKLQRGVGRATPAPAAPFRWGLVRPFDAVPPTLRGVSLPSRGPWIPSLSPHSRMADFRTENKHPSLFTSPSSVGKRTIGQGCSVVSSHSGSMIF